MSSNALLHKFDRSRLRLSAHCVKLFNTLNRKRASKMQAR